MSQTPASKITDAIKKEVQSSGGQFRCASWRGRRGCPDCFMWWTWPNAGFIEVKADYGKGRRDRYSKLQAREVHRMQEAGIPVLTVSSVDEVPDAVKKLRKGLAT